MTSTYANKLRQSKEWIRKSQEWRALRKKKPGVDDAKGTPGMYDAIPGVEDEVDHEATPELDNDAPDTANESDEAKIEQTNVEHVSGTMSLHRHPIQ